MDAVVVDTEKTGKECIQYIKDKVLMSRLFQNCTTYLFRLY